MIRQTLNEWPQVAKRYSADAENGCLNWTRGKLPKGYGMVRIDGHWGPAHRVAYRYYHGHIPEGMCVLHDCDNPSCVNPLHLRLGTNSDNIADKVAKDRAGKKLNQEDVSTIRTLFGRGVTQAKLSKQFGVSQGTISRILSGKRWSPDHAGRQVNSVLRPATAGREFT